MSGLATQYAEALGETASLPVLICDRDHCIAAAGISKKSVISKNVSTDLENIMENRKTVCVDGDKSLLALDGIERNICVASPILSSGDISGAVVLISDENGTKPSDSDIKLSMPPRRWLRWRTCTAPTSRSAAPVPPWPGRRDLPRWRRFCLHRGWTVLIP